MKSTQESVEERPIDCGAAVLLAKTCQVFSITHLPQVACMADHQYLIEKKLEASRTMTQVENPD